DHVWARADDEVGARVDRRVGERARVAAVLAVGVLVAVGDVSRSAPSAPAWMATMTTGAPRAARAMSDRARRRSSRDDAQGYGANPSSATPTPLTVRVVIWPGRPVHGTPARPSAANVWAWPEAPK